MIQSIDSATRQHLRTRSMMRLSQRRQQLLEGSVLAGARLSAVAIGAGSVETVVDRPQGSARRHERRRPRDLGQGPDRVKRTDHLRLGPDRVKQREEVEADSRCLVIGFRPSVCAHQVRSREHRPLNCCLSMKAQH